MGAEEFVNTMRKEKEPEVTKAFLALVEAAAWEHGHGGYTGTIAEKTGHTRTWQIPDGTERDDIIVAFDYGDEDNKLNELALYICEKYGRHTYDDMISIWNDKWGPALSLETSTHWIFTGLASS